VIRRDVQSTWAIVLARNVGDLVRQRRELHEDEQHDEEPAKKSSATV
jgi:hypothetical protein